MKSNEANLVITGVGVVCTLGSELEAMKARLRTGQPTAFDPYPEAAALGLGCTIYGAAPTPSDDDLEIRRKQSRFMGRASRLALWAAQHTLAQAQHDTADLAVVVGSGTGDVEAHIETSDCIRRTGSARRVPATLIPRIMGSTVAANLSNALRTSGPSVSAAAACAGGAWNIAIAAQLVASGHAPAALAGGVEVRDIHFHAGFDRMHAYNRHDNDRPSRASRPYAADRAGFIFGEGAGIVLIEREEAALARGATILGRILGWGMSSDGQGKMVAPSSDGAARSMRSALAHAGLQPEQIGYVNTHATSTPAGDLIEVNALREVFPQGILYSSTKGYTGHTISGAGAIEAIFTLEMLREGWIAPCVGADPLDPGILDYPPVLKPTPTDASIALSNSFGFGGTNATLVLGRA